MLQLRNSFFSSLICYEYFVLFNYLCGERFRLQLQMKTVNSFSSNSVTSLRRMDYVLKRKKLIHVCGISTEIRSNSMWPLPPRKKENCNQYQSECFLRLFITFHVVCKCDDNSVFSQSRAQNTTIFELPACSTNKCT